VLDFAVLQQPVETCKVKISCKCWTLQSYNNQAIVFLHALDFAVLLLLLLLLVFSHRPWTLQSYHYSYYYCFPTSPTILLQSYSYCSYHYCHHTLFSLGLFSPTKTTVLLLFISGLFSPTTTATKNIISQPLQDYIPSPTVNGEFCRPSQDLSVKKPTTTTTTVITHFTTTTTITNVQSSFLPKI
jgi:hypothetical protein